MRKKYVILIKHIIYIAAIAIIEIIGCPFYKLFHITCPACGTTRAWLCALKGNFREAFGYNLFFILIPVFLLLAVHAQTDFFKRHFKYRYIFLISFSVILAIYNILRVIYFPLK